MFALINVKSRRRKGSMGIAAGHLWPYVFDGKRAAMPRPKWRP